MHGLVLVDVNSIFSSTQLIYWPLKKKHKFWCFGFSILCVSWEYWDFRATFRYIHSLLLAPFHACGTMQKHYLKHKIELKAAFCWFCVPSPGINVLPACRISCFCCSRSKCSSGFNEHVRDVFVVPEATAVVGSMCVTHVLRCCRCSWINSNAIGATGTSLAGYDTTYSDELCVWAIDLRGNSTLELPGSTSITQRSQSSLPCAAVLWGTNTLEVSHLNLCFY